MHAKPQNLPELRQCIAEIDRDIMRLAAKRVEVARQIGAHKLEQNLPIKDYRVEKTVIERNLAVAKDCGALPDMVEALSRTLIKYAVLTQDEFHQKAKAADHQSPQKRILILGGHGQMGQWLAHFFRSFSHTVHVVDKSPKPAPTVENANQQHFSDSFPYYDTLDSALAHQDFEVIVLATPIGATASLIDQLTETSFKGLVFDVCSLKAPLLAAIRRAENSGLNITSIHPMFGPQVKMLAGRNILFCEGAQEEATRQALELFADTSAVSARIPLEKHDTLMSYVLGLSHMVNILFAKSLENSGFSAETLRALGSTTFLAQLNVSEPVVSENPELYYAIQAENPATQTTISAYSEAIREFQQTLDDHDPKAFQQLMQSAKDYLLRSNC